MKPIFLTLQNCLCRNRKLLVVVDNIFLPMFYQIIKILITVKVFLYVLELSSQEIILIVSDLIRLRIFINFFIVFFLRWVMGLYGKI